jgi:hypothetical protein
MNKSNSCIYILARFPVFNIQELPVFESFDRIHSELLYSSLLLNYKELLEENAASINFYFILDMTDKESAPETLLASDNVIWINNSEQMASLKIISDKYFSNYNNNIVIPADSIGISLVDIKKIINLLSIEDDSIVAGKTFNDKISILGFNKLSGDYFSSFSWKQPEYNKGLTALCKENAFLHIVDGPLLVENCEEYKQLYIELSKKESLAYCGQSMHERFTSLFIEYKDLLK